MATYNEIYSSTPSALVEGTEGNDSIAVYGNHSTVDALGGADIISVNGGRHDSGIWLEGDETNLINAGAGNDSIKVTSRGASVFGDAGNDTISVRRSYTYANGGAGDDLLDVDRYDSRYDLNYITLTGGAGKDTLQIHSYYDDNGINVVVTDFSNDDVLRLQEYYSYTGNYRRVLTQTVENGNVVIRDNSSINSSYYSDDVITKTVDPLLSITLQGVSDISEVANAKYYVYDGTTPKEYKTFGELFGVSSSTTTPTVPATVEPVPVAETVEPATVQSAKDTVEPVTVQSAKDTVEPVTVPTSTDDEKDTSSTVSSVTGGTGTNDTLQSGSGKGDTIIYVGEGGKYVAGDDNSTNTTVTSNSSVSNETNNVNIDNSTTTNTTNNTTIINNVNNIYTYNGGNKTISSYAEGQVVELKSDYQGIDVNGNSFLVKSSSGDLSIQNSRDKFIGYSASNTDVVAYSYLGAKAGAIDGRDKSQAEIFIGGDHVDNQIYAGNGGSSLWGGNGGTDTMTGGDGYDEFFFAIGSGNDVIQNAGDNDVVNLLGVSLEQITYAEISSSDIHIGFTDGGHLQLQGQSATGFKLGNVTYTANRATGEWTTK